MGKKYCKKKKKDIEKKKNLDMTSVNFHWKQSLNQKIQIEKWPEPKIFQPITEQINFVSNTF